MLTPVRCACIPVVLLSLLMAVLTTVTIIPLLLTILFIVSVILLTHYILVRAVRQQDITLTLRTVLAMMSVRFAAIFMFALLLTSMNHTAAVELIALACTSLALSVISEAFTFIRVQEEPLHA